MRKERIRKAYIDNENGSVLVIALVMLAFISLLGISVTTTSTTEVQIAGNDRIYKQNVYKAEAAAMEGAQRIENETSKQVLMRATPTAWLSDSDSMTTPTTADSWDHDGEGGNDNSQAADASIDSEGNTYFSVVDRGIAPGGSLSMGGGTQLHEYAVYGFYNGTQGQVLVEIGYRKRF
ncbi:MAG: hypothetical protein C4530_02570 [Desulfobacteraceae bacterium]|nr:MAG: hypothetical protein C4530_02570 [Desulfobacteraceae bacterium]